MRIGIDARFLGPDGSGIGRYIKNLLIQLSHLDQENEYVVFVRPIGKSYLPQLSDRFHIVPVSIPWYSLREQVILPFIFWRYRLSLLHVPHMNVPWFYGGDFVVTIHDLTKLARSAPDPIIASGHHIITLKFTETPIMLIADIITLSSGFIMFIILIKHYAKSNRSHASV